MWESRSGAHCKAENRKAKHEDANARADDAMRAGEKGAGLQRRAVNKLFLVPRTDVTLFRIRKEYWRTA